ncbi:hypothetical protein TEK04_13930 [Klenkia sp. LSe6-5]|uniref:Uncharacterized protein n=1 Tax=Klenkia sesuvii TaxID=3103137 RepID=A0ABU8DXR9_9ACTN
MVIASVGADGSDRGAAAAVLLPTIALCAALAVGALALVRRTGRRLLLVATVVEVVAATALGLWALEEASSLYDPAGLSPGPGVAFTVAAVALLLAGLATPVVRLALLLQPAVDTWLTTAPPPAPQWSAHTQQWTPAPHRGRGTVIAVLTPAVLLLAATVVVLTTARGGLLPPLADGTGFVPDQGSGSQWSDLYDGGTPIEPPTEDSPLYEAQYDADAQDCYAGDLGACDDLYYATEVGSLYEWLGSTCGGREEYETFGLCD